MEALYGFRDCPLRGLLRATGPTRAPLVCVPSYLPPQSFTRAGWRHAGCCGCDPCPSTESSGGGGVAPASVVSAEAAASSCGPGPAHIAAPGSTTVATM